MRWWQLAQPRLLLWAASRSRIEPTGLPSLDSSNSGTSGGGAGGGVPRIETFCETPRFVGTCYRAANWFHLGQTQGRGKLDTRHEYNQPVKNVFVKPLCPDWKAILNR